MDTDSGTTGNQDTLTFAAADWSTAQTVTVTGVDDAAEDGDQGYSVTLTVDQTDTADAKYDALGTVSVSVSNRDDEGATADVNDDEDVDRLDVNDDGDVDRLDALLMYYAYTFRQAFELETELGTRVRRFLSTLRGPDSSYPDNDTGYKDMLDAAWGLQ